MQQVKPSLIIRQMIGEYNGVYSGVDASLRVATIAASQVDDWKSWTCRQSYFTIERSKTLDDMFPRSLAAAHLGS